MAFQKKNWQFNDIITEGELNRMEDGIEKGITKAEQAQTTAVDAATAAANAQATADAAQQTADNAVSAAANAQAAADAAQATANNHASRHAAGGPDEITPEMIGAETPTGAQQKADQAETNAKNYTDQQIANIEVPVTSVNGKTGAVTLTKSDIGLGNVDNVKQASKTDFDAHKAEEATDEKLGHVKVDGETITASNGIISAQTQIVDTVTSDKWKWGMENGIVFLEKVVV